MQNSLFTNIINKYFIIINQLDSPSITYQNPNINSIINIILYLYYMSFTLIASILEIVLFTLAIFVTLVRISQSYHFQNRKYFNLFHMEIIAICLLTVASGCLNLILSTNHEQMALYLDQTLNNFCLILQISLIVTITYGWKTLSIKLKGQFNINNYSLKRYKIGYLILVLIMLVLYSLLVVIITYFFIKSSYSKQIRLSLNLSELIISLVLLGVSFLQLRQGRQLSIIINRLSALININISQFKFKLIYIGAFSLNILRQLIQIARLCYFLSNNNDLQFLVNTQIQFIYFLMYEFAEILPIFLYLIGINIKYKNEQKQKEQALRESIQSSQSKQSNRFTHKHIELMQNFNRT